MAFGWMPSGRKAFRQTPSSLTPQAEVVHNTQGDLVVLLNLVVLLLVVVLGVTAQVRVRGAEGMLRLVHGSKPRSATRSKEGW